MPRGTHTQHESYPWTTNIADHPDRTDSPAYTRSRELMIKLVQTSQPWVFGERPYQDHHGGGIWVKDSDGWLLLLSPFGIEWSAQFCADPKKVDHARQYCIRVLAAFPDTVAGYEGMGYSDAAALLETQITTAEDVAQWTDGIFNASVPLPVAMHTGALPRGAGYHHYPKPIVDITLFKYDDFTLFVPDGDGRTIAVTPVAPRGSNDGRVAVAWAPDDFRRPTRAVHPAFEAGSGNSDGEAQVERQTTPRLSGDLPEESAVQAPRAGGWVILPADSVAARAAFAHQTESQ